MRECERRLKFFERDEFGVGTVLPENWANDDYRFKNCLPHFVQWVLVISVIAAYSIYELFN